MRILTKTMTTTTTTTSCRLVGGRRAAQAWRPQDGPRQDLEDAHHFLLACERMQARRAARVRRMAELNQSKREPEPEQAVDQDRDLLVRALLRNHLRAWRKCCKPLSRKSNARRWAVQHQYFVAWVRLALEQSLLRMVISQWHALAQREAAKRREAAASLASAFARALRRQSWVRWLEWVKCEREMEESQKILRKALRCWSEYAARRRGERVEASRRVFAAFQRSRLRRAFRELASLPALPKPRLRRPPCEYVRENFRAFDAPRESKSSFVVRPAVNLRFHDKPERVLQLRIHDSLELLERAGVGHSFPPKLVAPRTPRKYELWPEDEIILTNSFLAERTPRPRTPHRSSSSFWV